MKRQYFHIETEAVSFNLETYQFALGPHWFRQWAVTHPVQIIIDIIVDTCIS